MSLFRKTPPVFVVIVVTLSFLIIFIIANQLPRVLERCIYLFNFYPVMYIFFLFHFYCYTTFTLSSFVYLFFSYLPKAMETFILASQLSFFWLFHSTLCLARNKWGGRNVVKVTYTIAIIITTIIMEVSRLSNHAGRNHVGRKNITLVNGTLSSLGSFLLKGVCVCVKFNEITIMAVKTGSASAVKCKRVMGETTWFFHLAVYCQA